VRLRARELGPLVPPSGSKAAIDQPSSQSMLNSGASKFRMKPFLFAPMRSHPRGVAPVKRDVSASPT